MFSIHRISLDADYLDGAGTFHIQLFLLPSFLIWSSSPLSLEGVVGEDGMVVLHPQLSPRATT